MDETLLGRPGLTGRVAESDDGVIDLVFGRIGYVVEQSPSGRPLAFSGTYALTYYEAGLSSFDWLKIDA